MPGVPLPSLLSAPARAIDFRASRIRWPEWAVAVSALLVLVFMVGLSWFSLTSAPGGTRATTPPSVGGGLPIHPMTGPVPVGAEDGWHGLGYAHWLLLVTIILALALLVIQATHRAPPLPVTVSLLVMFLAGLSAIWLIVRVLIDPPGGRDAGGWLALICTLLLTWSAYKSVRLEGIAPEDEPAEIPTVHLADLPPTIDPQ